jgi:hypothetical protein
MRSRFIASQWLFIYRVVQLEMVRALSGSLSPEKAGLVEEVLRAYAVVEKWYA